ncbi:hypothetical protein NDU88_002053 [Pleurodeles waltl]|uniref:Uncharacterized protein n=1 Tax=Pleurodeles waltl TaxID=8319 RepID=A0AAV7M122_PLEWA|nr:hypothetical protein NDU88_002053 [Pleurodeles waltl]
MAVTPAAVRTAAVHTATAGAHRHWLLKLIGFNENQCGFAPRSSTAYRHGVPRQRIDLTSHWHTSQAPSAGQCEEMEESSRVQTAGGPVDNGVTTCHSDIQAWLSYYT